MSLIVRHATVADAQALLDLRKAAILAGCAGFYTEEVLIAFTDVEVNPAFLSMLAGQFYVAEEAGCMVGSGMIDLASGQVDAIFVAPQAAGRGAQ